MFSTTPEPPQGGTKTRKLVKVPLFKPSSAFNPSSTHSTSTSRSDGRPIDPALLAAAAYATSSSSPHPPPPPRPRSAHQSHSHSHNPRSQHQSLPHTHHVPKAPRSSHSNNSSGSSEWKRMRQSNLPPRMRASSSNGGDDTMSVWSAGSDRTESTHAHSHTHTRGRGRERSNTANARSQSGSPWHAASSYVPVITNPDPNELDLLASPTFPVGEFDRGGGGGIPPVPPIPASARSRNLPPRMMAPRSTPDLKSKARRKDKERERESSRSKSRHPPVSSSHSRSAYNDRERDEEEYEYWEEGDFEYRYLDAFEDGSSGSQHQVYEGDAKFASHNMYEGDTKISHRLYEDDAKLAHHLYEQDIYGEDLVAHSKEVEAKLSRPVSKVIYHEDAGVYPQEVRPRSKIVYHEDAGTLEDQYALEAVYAAEGASFPSQTKVDTLHPSLLQHTQGPYIQYSIAGLTQRIESPDEKLEKKANPGPIARPLTKEREEAPPTYSVLPNPPPPPPPLTEAEKLLQRGRPAEEPLPSLGLGVPTLRSRARALPSPSPSPTMGAAPHLRPPNGTHLSPSPPLSQPQSRRHTPDLVRQISGLNLSPGLQFEMLDWEGGARGPSPHSHSSHAGNGKEAGRYVPNPAFDPFASSPEGSPTRENGKSVPLPPPETTTVRVRTAVTPSSSSPATTAAGRRRELKIVDPFASEALTPSPSHAQTAFASQSQNMYPSHVHAPTSTYSSAYPDYSHSAYLGIPEEEEYDDVMSVGTHGSHY